MLISLSLIAILLLLYIPIQHHTLLNLEEKQFFEQLDYDLQLLQNKSLGSTNTWALHFENDGYRITTSKQAAIINRTLPKQWRINYRLSNTIHYSKTSTFKIHSSIYIHKEKKNNPIVIQI